MTPRVIWVAVATTGVVTSAHATTYLTLEQAQQAIFPGATLRDSRLKLTSEQRKAIEKTSGIKVRAVEVRLWLVEGGGWFVLDEVVGKHEFITYAVGLTKDGAVKQIEIMDYRENYGGQVRDKRWRSQFVGKAGTSKLKLDDDIKNISGATLSCRHITEGIKRLLALHDLVLK